MVPVAQKSITNKEIERAIEAINEGVWTEGRFCEQFSQQLKDYHGRKYCQLVNSGSSANFIALAACKTAYNWADGDEVITCALGFPTTAAPIIQLGMKPIFVDTLGLNIDYTVVEKYITRKTRAVMVAHTLGFPFNIKEIRRICNKHNLLLIEDCCDALGSRYEDILCGTLGDVSTFSFYPAHCITTIEGGAVLTNDSRIQVAAMSLTNWGRACICKPGQDDTCGHRFSGKAGGLPQGWDHKYTYNYLGWNLKMNDIEAAIGTEQMKRLDNFIKIRRDNYTYYAENIIYTHEELKNANPFGFVMYVDDSVSFIKKLVAKGVGARLVMGGNLLRQPAFRKLDDYRKYPNASKTSDTTLWIGVQPSLSMEEKEQVISIINSL